MVHAFWHGTPCAPFELQTQSSYDSPHASLSAGLGQASEGSKGGAWSACTHLTRYGLNTAPFFMRFLALQLQPQSALELGCGLGTTADFLARFTEECSFAANFNATKPARFRSCSIS